MSGPRLSITPAGAIFDRRLEPRDQQVLNLLGCYTDKAGWCRRSQVKMAKQLFCGRSSIQRSLENLVAAGWVQKKRPPWSKEEGQPSNSYMYRVILDRDDFVIPDQDETGADDDDTYAENASEEIECPPVGTPEKPADGHPGAQPSVGTGAQPYVGTKNAPLERPLIERERDTRARDTQARFLVDFETRWPTSAADDRQRTAYAAENLTEDEQQAALAGIGPFLDDLKRHHRKGVPAGWKYLEQKRWTLLVQPKAADQPNTGHHPLTSPEGRAIVVLHDIAGLAQHLRDIRIRNGVVSYPKPVTPQLLGLATNDPPSPEEWPALTGQQAAAWEEKILREFVTIQTRRKLREGSRAPWPWPPRKDGTLSTTGPPGEDSLMTEEDFAELR